MPEAEGTSGCSLNLNVVRVRDFKDIQGTVIRIPMAEPILVVKVLIHRAVAHASIRTLEDHRRRVERSKNQSNQGLTQKSHTGLSQFENVTIRFKQR